MPGQIWDIITAVQTKLQAIAPPIYLREVKKVYISRKIEDEIPNTKFPAIGMIIGGETSFDRVGLETVDYILGLTFQVFCSGTTDEDAYHQVCDLWEDIKNALYDEMFKTAHDYDTTHVGTNFPVVFPIGDKHASGVIAFQITYRDNYHN